LKRTSLPLLHERDERGSITIVMAAAKDMVAHPLGGCKEGKGRGFRLDQEMSRSDAWLLARAEHISLRDRLALLREEGSYAGALRRIGVNREGRLREGAEAALERIAGRGYRLLVLGEPGYPALLAAICDPPLVLTVRGEILREDALAISIVGSRRATPYGRDTARRLSTDLASSGLTIVSGLARGIDAAGHEGALTARGRTLAVLGSGLENLYPPEHGKLAEKIAERGAVISEFDLDEPPHARNFPRRNRVITGLSLGTLVVEAAAKSGSLISARLALDQNREVFAVPGPVSSPGSEGVHALLRDGARLVTRAEDVLEELRDEVRAALEHRVIEQRAPETLDADERAILTLLLSRHETLDLDSILDALSLPIDRALATLSRLELGGRVRRLPGGTYHARR
jgi:DNA processing protein